jgi:hypothetical protein
MQAESLVALCCYVMAECTGVDPALYVHTLYNPLYEAHTIFRKLDLLPSSGDCHYTNTSFLTIPNTGDTE